MPPHIYTEGLPEAPTPVPAWGTLPLDIYLLEQWESPNPDTPNESPDQRRKRLVSQWLKLGTIGREPYYDRTRKESQSYSPAHPTQHQIDMILRPLRPESLRRYAAGYRGWAGAEGMWIRTRYGPDSEDAHRALWDKYVEICQVVGPESLILDDQELFGHGDGGDGDAAVARVLELFPERVANYCVPEDVEAREAELAWFLREMHEYDEGDDDDAEVCPQRDGDLSAEEEMCERYWMYHAACVVTHVFIEDREAQEGKGVLHVFLDDCGNVVRRMRVDSTQVDNFDGAWFEGSWKEGWVELGAGELGMAYLPGGVRGPPYTL
ncbi:hypothetical protein BJX61DRAFT_525685 [Aspergillus egyptiacus]|nr:hypothetical protein BJX61DRAFT_525685 [Aspergillus egyptiacus]